MDVLAIVQYVVIVGVLLIAVPFPIALIASAVAWALAGFVAVESLWDSTKEPEANGEGRGHASG